MVLQHVIVPVVLLVCTLRFQHTAGHTICASSKQPNYNINRKMTVNRVDVKPPKDETLPFVEGTGRRSQNLVSSHWDVLGRLYTGLGFAKETPELYKTLVTWFKETVQLFALSHGQNGYQADPVSPRLNGRAPIAYAHINKSIRIARGSVALEKVNLALHGIYMQERAGNKYFGIGDKYLQFLDGSDQETQELLKALHPFANKIIEKYEYDRTLILEN